MHKKAAFLVILLSALAASVFAQTTYLPLNTEDNYLLDRLETRSGRLSDSLFLNMKPVMRNRAVDFLETQKEGARYSGLSHIDRYDIARMISENGEWTANEDGAVESKHPWVHTFYQKQFDFIHVHTNNFFLVVNPIISGELYSESNNKAGSLYWTARGAELRGWISKRIGFYTSVTDNQEKEVSFVDTFNRNHIAVPGADYYLGRESGKYDYLQASGYVDFSVIKDHMNVDFGYGKNFIGNGLTSMFLSDFSAAYPYLKITTRIWKINYQNLFMELTPTHGNTLDELQPHKYATMHHLSMNVTKWWNIGLFESIIFDRTNSYEIRYLNPIIFLGSMEQSLGSPDKKHLGFDTKIILLRHVQLYGQFLLDEFKASQFFGHNGWWGNKWALQMGAKYFDAFGIKNFDLQGELNIVRPYTYTHSDTIANYTNYNQPLANPLGADFIQFIGVAKYQPAKRLYLTAKLMYYIQGVDTGASDYGSNIFQSYNNRPQEYGVTLINGVKTNCILLNFNAAYELRPNLFLELGATNRSYTYQNGFQPNYTSTYFYGGFRLNIAKRDWEFY